MTTSRYDTVEDYEVDRDDDPRDAYDETKQEVLLWERERQAAANILGIKDQIHFADPNDASRLRSVVLRELAELTELACMMLRASAGGSVINEYWLEMLRDIHGAVVAPKD